MHSAVEEGAEEGGRHDGGSRIENKEVCCVRYFPQTPIVPGDNWHRYAYMCILGMICDTYIFAYSSLPLY